VDRDAIVYVIDDDAFVVRFIEMILANNYYPVHCFSSGKDFLAEPDHARVGCVIADLQLPGASGTEIQSQLQHRKSCLSVIFISGFADVPTAVRLMKHGAVTVLQKPFTPEQLLEAVQEGLAESQRRFVRQSQIEDIQFRLAQLTEDEAQILHCLLKGRSQKAMSSALNLSMRTLNRRQHSLLKKMKAASVSEMITILAESHSGSDQHWV